MKLFEKRLEIAAPSIDFERASMSERAAYIIDMAHQLKRMALADGHEVAAYMLEMTVLEMRDRFSCDDGKSA